MKLSPKAQTALNNVVARFRAGDLSPVTDIATLKRDAVPFDKWLVERFAPLFT